MFNIFKAEKLQKVIGKIERIGVTPDEEYSLTYVIKLQNDTTIYTCELDQGSARRNEMALTEKNDEVSFECNKDNELDSDSFKNVTFQVN